ncbi:hypothetical protein HYH03_006213 [Edaphochlamys debaryana]|uniref:Uncharacterized protein n=1 Tax=Edaphochlamys debaryana TaxID=47281 RepID=A0A836C1H2_9CHLO|nr:hypothetical protein HYH03_006213 [Edaphochlamys debaryana]|eukprot:KAG2495613.1 hypothetical protein HYH03_006213 [Edaphochlamys debaryana]
MKWLKFLKVKKRTLEGGAETGVDDGAGTHKHKSRRSMQHDRKESRTSIEQWHEARKSRTSIDICSAFNVTTTERLSVCKAGITLLINRTYIVIKHLGSGTSGQVKLAFNLRSKKLVAIKAVRKNGGGPGHLSGGRDARSYDGRTGLGSLSRNSGLSRGLHPCQSVGCVSVAAGSGGGSSGAEASGGGAGGSGAAAAAASGGGGGSVGRGWRSMTPSSILRRSASSGPGSWGACRGNGASPSRVRATSGGPSVVCGSGAATGSAAPAPGLCETEDFVREIAILKRLSHPNIVQLVEVIDDPASDCLLLVMGYVEGDTLQPQQVQPGRWRQVPEQQVWRHMRDVLCGLEYLHCHGVVHGDLKPANFIQDSLTGVVRILDFGSAVLHGHGVGEDGLRGAHVPMSCTPGFRSPESLVAGYRPSFELDMWALGVCVYMLLFGELPFKGSAPFVVYENIRSAPLALPSHTRISEQLRDLLMRLLDKDPTRRMTVHDAVVHPWVTAQGLAPLPTTSPLVMASRMQLAAEHYLSNPPPPPSAAQLTSPLPGGEAAMGSAAGGGGSSGTGGANLNMGMGMGMGLGGGTAAAGTGLSPQMQAAGAAAALGGGGGNCRPPRPFRAHHHHYYPRPVSQSGTNSSSDPRAEDTSQGTSMDVDGAGAGAGPGSAQAFVRQGSQPQPPQSSRPLGGGGGGGGSAGFTPSPPFGSHSNSTANLVAAGIAAANAASAGVASAGADAAAAANGGAFGAGRGGDTPGEMWMAAAASMPSVMLSGLPPPPGAQRCSQPPGNALRPQPQAVLGSQLTPPNLQHLAMLQQAGGSSDGPLGAGAGGAGPWRMAALQRQTSGSGSMVNGSATVTGTGLGTGSGLGTGTGMSLAAMQDYPYLPFMMSMPGIAEGSIGSASSLGGFGSPAAAAAAIAAISAGNGNGSVGGGGRRNSCEAWQLRRSVTEQELQAAISSCCDPAGSAAVLMETIFSEVTFPAKQQIIRAGDPLDRIYLITAGEVEIYHDLLHEGPDPDKPIIQGLEDPEADLDDPGDFLNIRLPDSRNVPQLERLSTGLLNMTGGGGGTGTGAGGGGGGGTGTGAGADRSNHGGSHAIGAAALAYGGGAGGYAAAVAAAAAAAAAAGVTSPLSYAGGASPMPGIGATSPLPYSTSRSTLGGLERKATGTGAGGGAREASGSSIGLYSRNATQTGHLIVAIKGPGDSLGFAGMLPNSAGGGSGGQPVWSASVRARTQVTAFAASIGSLHSLAKSHPQVEPLLQQMVVQQETDLAVAEAMRALRLVGSSRRNMNPASGAGSGGGAGTGGSGVGQPAPTVPSGPSASASADQMAKLESGGGVSAVVAAVDRVFGGDSGTPSGGGGHGGCAAGAVTGGPRGLLVAASGGGGGGRMGGGMAGCMGGAGAFPTGLSSEGESESCGTAGTTTTGYAASSQLASAGSVPQRMAGFLTGASGCVSSGVAVPPATAFGAVGDENFEVEMMC